MVELSILMCLMDWMSFGQPTATDLKGCIGLESRVVCPRIFDRVINSPGEPGISYHMGTGFATTRFLPKHRNFWMGCVRPPKPVTGHGRPSKCLPGPIGLGLR